MFRSLIFISLLLPFTSSWGVELLHLKSDKEAYLPNEKAVVVVEVSSFPRNPNYEVIIKSELNSHEVETVKLSDERHLFKIADVGAGPLAIFKSKYFIRDTHQAKEYERAITRSDLKIMDLIKTRRSVSSSERAAIDFKIEEEERHVSYYRGKIEGLLRYVGEKSLIATVSSVWPTPGNAFIFLSSAREARSYAVGDKLVLFGHVYLEIFDKDILVKASLGNTPLKVEKLLNDEFIINSESFTVADQGNQQAVVELYLRDKARSDKLLKALASVNAESLRLVLLLGAVVDPVERAILESEIEKLSQLKEHIESTLNGLEQFIEAVIYDFFVESL